MNIRDIIENRFDEMNQKMCNRTEEIVNEYLYENFGWVYSNELCEQEFGIVMESIGEKLSNIKNTLLTKIKEMWKKIKIWVGKLIQNITLSFASGQKLAAKYAKEIQTQYKKQCNTMKLNSVQYRLDFESHDKLWDILLDLIDAANGNVEEAVITPISLNIAGVGTIEVINSSGNLNTANLDEINNIYFYGDNVVKERLLKDTISLEGIRFGLVDCKDIVKSLKDKLKQYEEMMTEETTRINNMKESDFENDTEYRNWVKNQTMYNKIANAMGVYFNKSFASVAKRVNKTAIKISKRLLKNAGIKTEGANTDNEKEDDNKGDE